MASTIFGDEPLHLGMPPEALDRVMRATAGDPKAFTELAEQALAFAPLMGDRAALAAASIPATIAAFIGGKEQREFLASIWERQAEDFGGEQSLQGLRWGRLEQLASLYKALGDEEGVNRALASLAEERPVRS